MTHLLFGDFALMPGPAMAFPKHILLLPRVCAIPRLVFPRFSIFLQHGWTAVGRAHAQLLTHEGSKEIQQIFSLRGRNRRSLTAVM